MFDSNQRVGEINKQPWKKFSICALVQPSRDNSENIFNFQQFRSYRCNCGSHIGSFWVDLSSKNSEHSVFCLLLCTYRGELSHDF